MRTQGRSQALEAGRQEGFENEGWTARQSVWCVSVCCGCVCECLLWLCRWLLVVVSEVVSGGSVCLLWCQWLIVVSVVACVSFYFHCKTAQFLIAALNFLWWHD